MAPRKIEATPVVPELRENSNGSTTDERSSSEETFFMKTLPQRVSLADGSGENNIRRWIEAQPSYSEILKYEKTRRKDDLEKSLFLARLFADSRPKAPPTNRAVSPSKGCCGS